MKEIKIKIDADIFDELEALRKEIGHKKVQDYIRMVIGTHVKDIRKTRALAHAHGEKK